MNKKEQLDATPNFMPRVFGTKSTVVPSILGSRRWPNIQMWSQ